MNEYEKHNGDENYYFKLCETLEIKLIQKQAEIETLQSYGYRTQYELLRIEFIQQQAEIEALKQNIGQIAKPDLKIEEVMSEHCTCYKLGYSPFNDYAAVKQK
jgi:hypothetical protein